MSEDPGGEEEDRSEESERGADHRAREAEGQANEPDEREQDQSQESHPGLRSEIEEGGG